MWERLESREIRRRRASSARIAARRGITSPPAGDRPRPDRPEGDDLLPQIRHVVILMMENHSYDNYLGTLTDRGEGLPLGADGNPDVVNYLPNGRGYPAHHFSSTTQLKNDPSQSWHASHIQYADGRNDGFAAAVAAKWNLPSLTRRDAAAESPLNAVDLAAEPAFAEPPKLPEPARPWGSWGRQPRRRRARDLKWRSVRLAQRRCTRR